MIGKVVIGSLIFIVLLVEVIGIHYVTIQNGSHTGVITAVETTGIIFKTVTVYVKTDPMSSQEDTYCLIDRSLIPKLIEKEEAKEKVTVIYTDYLVKGQLYCNGESGGIITGING